MTIKILNIPSKLPECNLPNKIIKHCNQYKDTYMRKASLFAWFCLSKYIDLNKVQFSKNGKPTLIGNSKYFSLSHSFNKVAIAICSKPIGIDIEKCIPLSIASPLASRLLKGKNLQQYHNAKDQSLWFTKYWTKYEAYHKLNDSKFELKLFFKKINDQIVTKVFIDDYKQKFVYTYIVKKSS